MRFVEKIIIPIIVICLVAAPFLNKPVSAGTSDTFDITVTGEFIWMDITNASWALGTVAMSSYKWTNQTGVTFITDMDNCTVNTDLKLQITVDGAIWTAATTGNGPGADIFRLNASIDTWAGGAYAGDQILLASQTTISSNIVAGNNESFDLRFDTPTTTSTADQQTVTITATVIKT